MRSTDQPRVAEERSQDHLELHWVGRNPAKRPVYDRVTGKVHDGIDVGVLNAHSGAESNIAAGQALLGEIAGITTVHAAAIERPDEHSLMDLVSSGYLERLGFDYKPASPETLYRQPHTVAAAHAG